MRDGISMARGNNGVIMRALLAPVISRGTLILVQTFIRSNRNDIFISFEKRGRESFLLFFFFLFFYFLRRFIISRNTEDHDPA